MVSGKATGVPSTLTWEVPGDLREGVSPGMYFVAMECEGERVERKVLLLGGDVQ
jgi:hypothetical protein